MATTVIPTVPHNTSLESMLQHTNHPLQHLPAQRIQLTLLLLLLHSFGPGKQTLESTPEQWS
jgi:hypothetical protein